MENQPTTTTEKAEMVRLALKTSFPDTKFTVHSARRNGGNAINIEWTDGPAQRNVKFAIDYLGGGATLIQYNRSFSIEFTKRMAAAIAKNTGLVGPEVSKTGGIISDNRELGIAIFKRMRDTSF